MKTLLTSTALVAMMSTSAMAFTSPTVAGTAVWNGDSPDLGDTCTFISNEPGVMKYNTTTHVWSTTATGGKAAEVEIALVKQAQNKDYPKNIKVEPAIWNGSAWEAGGSTIDIHNGNSVSNPLSVPTDVHKATIDYTSGNQSDVLLNGSSIVNNTTAKVNTSVINSDAHGNINGTLKFVIGGTAEHNTKPPQLLSNENYQASHIITCLK